MSRRNFSKFLLAAGATAGAAAILPRAADAAAGPPEVILYKYYSSTVCSVLPREILQHRLRRRLPLVARSILISPDQTGIPSLSRNPGTLWVPTRGRCRKIDDARGLRPRSITGQHHRPVYGWTCPFPNERSGTDRRRDRADRAGRPPRHGTGSAVLTNGSRLKPTGIVRSAAGFSRLPLLRPALPVPGPSAAPHCPRQYPTTGGRVLD